MRAGASRLALGTVQFGLAYGVANRMGQIRGTDATEILAAARDAGVDTLDTAVAYGDSERVLGTIGVTRWRVISKLPQLPQAETQIVDWVRGIVRTSLERLRVGRLHGLLLHCSADLLGPGGSRLYDAMVELKEQSLVDGIGVSVYDPDELERLTPRFRFDLVQAPFNVIDRRIESSGWFRRLSDSGVEIHTRSAFLQGLLLMEHGTRPRYFARWESLWLRWRDWLGANGISAVQACLGFVLSRAEISRVVVGVDSAAHLREVLAAADRTPTQPPEDLSSADVDLVNPARWPKP